MAITDAHVLPQDLVIIPVADLDPDMRSSIEHQDGDFAITRPRSRTAAKIVDAMTGRLLQQFASPRPIVDAVLEFGDMNGVDPQQLLADAFPVLQRFIHAGLLVEVGSKRERRILAEFEQGCRVSEWEVVHCLQVLEDVELYQVKHSDGKMAALKIARDEGRPTRRMLEREAAILERLGGTIAPRLLATGLESERTYFIMEWRPGASAGVVADELRTSSGGGDRRRLLELCARIVAAYAELHRCGVLHGDIHERNLLVDASGRVTIIDFGLSRALDGGDDRKAQRGGVGAYFEPEYALARREKRPVPPVSALGEQYSVAALVYALYTGVSYLKFSTDHAEAMRQIAEEPMQPFAARGAAPFPRLERILSRALNKVPSERWESLDAFAAALASIASDDSSDAATTTSATASIYRAGDVLDATLRRFAPGGSVFESGIVTAPTSNVNFGEAGVAYCLYRVALIREDAAMLSLADVWATRAHRSIGSPRAFYNPKIGLMHRTIGPTSLYHTQSGVHVVRALIARAMSDFVTMKDAIASFVESSGRRGEHLDLTLGRAGILLGCALLLEADPRSSLLDLTELRAFGDRVARELWSRVVGFPRIGDTSPMESLGIAHGWAGILYAVLRWRLAGRQPIDETVFERLEQLASVAEPDGRGLRWRWINNGRGESRQHGYMGGWCNGSAGFVHLWQTAATAAGDSRFLNLAAGAGWNAWEDSGEDSYDLCCGLPGRAYAHLSLYRATGDAAWYRRAVALTDRATNVAEDDDLSWVSSYTALYKSGLGAVLLLAELDRPEAARMPLFEHEGWPVVS
jgi:serine/threonine-protein kinase